METAPLIATLTSLMTVGLGITLMRLMRQDRQRSDARVAALVMLAAEPAPAAPMARAAVASMPFGAPPVRLQPRVAPAGKPAAPRAAAPPRPIAASIAETPLVREPEALFAPAGRPAGTPLVFIGIAAIVMAGLIALSFTWARPGSATATVETTAAIAAPAAASAQPLALVSLRHEQLADGALVISGVVRNPAGSIVRDRIFAAASLLDANGALIASVRAPLDFTSLAAGEESPFVVKVTGSSGVARYRIGFRDAGGTSVPHVDRR